MQCRLRLRDAGASGTGSEMLAGGDEEGERGEGVFCEDRGVTLPSLLLNPLPLGVDEFPSIRSSGEDASSEITTVATGAEDERALLFERVEEEVPGGCQR